MNSSTLLSLASSLVCGSLCLGCGGSSGGGGGLAPPPSSVARPPAASAGGGGTQQPPPPPAPTSGGGGGGGGGGTSGSSGGGSVDERRVGELVLESCLAPTAIAEVALQATLSLTLPGTFDPPIGPTLTASGTPTSGTVLVDFGSGSILNQLTLNGAVMVSWDQTGPNAWTVTVTFTRFGTDSLIGGSSSLDGALTLAVSVTGSVATTGLSGSVTRVTSSLLSGTSTLTIAPNLVYTIDRAAAATVLDGSLTVTTDSGTVGGWTASARSLTFADDSVQSGELELERDSFPRVEVLFEFTAPDEGEWTLTPPGVSGTFSL
jgi:hypothetical protein